MAALATPRTVAAAVATRLREAILDGSYPPGTQLRQDALAESFAVSRIPVREALVQLEAEGLVASVPHKGAVVAPLSLAEITDVFDLRGLLEPRLLRSAAPRLTAADLDRAEAIEAEFEAALAAGRTERLGELNARFHAALHAPAALPRTGVVVEGLLRISDRYTRLQLASEAAYARAVDEHRRLLAHLRAGDGEGAATLLAAHVAAVGADLERLARASATVTPE